MRTEYEGSEFYQGCSADEFKQRSQNCTIITGDQVLSDFRMDFVSTGEAFAIMIGLFALAFGVAIISLSRLSRKRQG
eukprot:gene2484-5414_t